MEMDNLEDFVCIDDGQTGFNFGNGLVKKQVNFDEFVIKKMTEETINDVFEIENKLLGTSNINSIKVALSSDTLSYYTLINVTNNEVVGFLEVSIIGPDCELYDIAIKKSYQGKHLSNLLMQYLIDLCLEKKCETIFLEVNSINSKAIRLYKKFGFSKYSIRKNYYGKFDAVLMKKDLV